MKYFGLFFIIILLFFQDGYAQRKKVGVVLSGGGAKGVAAYWCIESVEEAGHTDRLYSGYKYGSYCGWTLCSRV